jgi:hypothetical protein
MTSEDIRGAVALAVLVLFVLLMATGGPKGWDI